MPHGKICHLEIPAHRAEDAASFYAEIFGWKVAFGTLAPGITTPYLLERALPQ